ncbi:MAG: DUF1684 domain-containing protein, partial [Candidatus Limnocylindria bacterium]
MHRSAVEAWRAQRYAALRRDTGWLALAGLGWLEPGVNVVGTDAVADVIVPKGPPDAGTITLVDGQLHATGRFTHGGEPVRDLPLVNDQQGEPTMLELGSLRLCVIERGGRLAVRTWDLDARARRDFDGIDHWPVDAEWHVEGRFEPTPGRALPVPNVLGTYDEQESPGDVRFELEGATHRLQALKGGDSGALWLVFADGTNGNESYGGGRFIYTDQPAADGRITVDFNRAYN